MPTKVFISWSGELSRKLGEALRKWLPGVLQYVKPYFTPDDIEKGAKWNSDIARELEEANIGLMCLTRDNTEKPWILFEGGALSKSFEQSRVCPILFNLDITDLKGPLTSFQTTRFNRDDFRRLVETINNAADEGKLEPQVLESVFEMWWPKLEQQVSDILSSHTEDNPEPHRTDRDILEEMLMLTRLSASVSGPSQHVSELAVRELMHALDRLARIAAREGDPSRILTLSVLNSSVNRLCIEAGITRAYEHFMARQNTAIGRAEAKKATDHDREPNG